jgi:hypothetical protein
LPSNAYTRHIPPSFRLFVPNGLQAYRNFLFFQGCACDVCDRSHLPSRGSAFRDVTAPAAPSSPRLPSGSLIRCQSVQVYHHHPVYPISGVNYLKWPVLLHFRLLLCVRALFPFRRGPTPPQCPDAHFLHPDGSMIIRHVNHNPTIHTSTQEFDQSNPTSDNSLSCVGVTTDGVLDCMIGFIDTLYTHNSGLQIIERYR